MGDRLAVVRAAVAQAAPVFLDREATVDKACELIARAGREGAEIVAFPEGFIPTHPVWYHFHAATGQSAIDMAAELFRNSVVVGGPATGHCGTTLRLRSPLAGFGVRPGH